MLGRYDWVVDRRQRHEQVLPVALPLYTDTDFSGLWAGTRRFGIQSRMVVNTADLR